VLLSADWRAAPPELPSALWSGRAPARLSEDKVGASVVAITGGTATATSMRATADGIAFPTDIAIELICVCELVCRREQCSRSVLVLRVGLGGAPNEVIAEQR